MEVLRNLFGNLTAGIIRLLVTVGILAAAYFFIVKPALHTTETISHEVNGNIQQSLKEGEIGRTLDQVNRNVQREIKRSIRHTSHPAQTDKLINCIRRARQDVEKIQRCTAKY
jgi:hypothetical protein